MPPEPTTNYHKPLTHNIHLPSRVPTNILHLALLSLAHYIHHIAIFKYLTIMTTALLYMLDGGDKANFREERDYRDDLDDAKSESSEESSSSNYSSESLAEDTKSLKLSVCRKRSFTIVKGDKTSPDDNVVSQESFLTFKKDFNLPLNQLDDFKQNEIRTPSEAFSSLPETFLRNHKNDSTTELSCQELKSISPNHLGYYMTMEGGQLLLIDCRSFVKFNHNHIKGAINACCTNNTIKKRFVCNKIEVVDLVSGVESKELFREALSKPRPLVVLYDEDTDEIDQPTSSNCLTLMHNRLSTQLGLNIRYLSGGMREFLRSQAHHCSTPVAMETKLLLSPTSPYVNAAIDSTTMTQILNHLYLGNEKDASDVANLLQQNITHLLNVSSSIPIFCQGTSIKTKRLPSSDSASQDIKQYFDEAICFIEEARKEGGRVLVHCQAGVSRSPTITMAYLMTHLKFSSYEAFNFVKEKRSIVSPNINFMGQLLAFEHRSGDFEGRSGDFEGQSADFEGQNGDFEGRSADFEGQSGDFEGQSGDFEGQSGDFEGQSGDFEGQSGDFEGQSGDFEGQSGDSEGQSGDFEGRSGDFEERSGDFEERSED